MLQHGRLRGADLWHLGCALYFRDLVGEAVFASADRRQAEVAKGSGFETL